MENQDKENREREVKLAEDTLNLNEKDIVKEIFYHSSIPKHHGPQLSLNRTLAYFSSLLFQLSQKAEESTKANIKIQTKLTNLTVSIVVLTVILLFVTVGQLYLAFQATKKPVIIYLKPDEPNKQAK